MVLIFAVPVFTWAETLTAKTEVINKVKLIKPIKANSKETVEAMFAALSPTATQAGLDSD